MDDKKLTALLTSVRLGSFSRAAEELGYTQSGLTYMMNSLETELGCRVLRRTYNGVTLTPHGEALLPWLRRASSALASLSVRAKELGGQPSVIRVGTYTSISASWLPQIIAGFTKQNPNVSVEMLVEDDPMLREWLESGEIELALVNDAMPGAYEWLPLYDDPLLAAVPRDCPLPDGPVSLKKLHSLAFIEAWPDDPYGVYPPEGGTRRIKVFSASDASAVSMVEQGLGVSVFPSLSLMNHSERIRVLPLDPPLHRTLGIAVMSLRNADPLTAKLISYCKKNLPDIIGNA